MITCGASYIKERSHIEILDDKGIYYSDEQTLKKVILEIPKETGKNWDAYSEKFNPKAVMDKFKEVFIDH